MARNIEKDHVTGTDTTGHEWDGIKELNTPLPRWWLWTFYATVVWSAGYVIAYPAIPLISSNTKGLLGYSSRADVAAEIAVAKDAQKQWLGKIEAASLEDIVKDPELLQFARAGGAAAFKVNCVQCHGAGAAGSAGYPNLNDDDWMWGGTLDQIQTTLVNGIRFAGNDDTRVSEMMANGNGEPMTPEQTSDTANYVLSLSAAEGVDAAAAERGRVVFAERTCNACHGDDGKGNKDLGAPNLTDKIWLYGGEVKAVMAQISKPRHGVMPAWGHRLDAATIKQLAVYVHSLGGGEQAAAQ
jgi:cytochrome c oxidase cbb3-type subunit 3